MRLGVIFPRDELPSDSRTIAAFARGAEDLGFDHLHVFDHVFGAHRSREREFRFFYTFEDSFHEPLVLFGYLAAITSRLELVTAVLVLPQRQTGLVAKQVAEIQALSGNRLRLGIGIGWNFVEYEALGVPFEKRWRRLDEQIVLLRRLLSEPLVDFAGEFHSFTRAGINPLAPSTPIWVGGMSPSALKRVGRLADGWIPNFILNPSGHTFAERFEGFSRMRTIIEAEAEAVGRSPNAIGHDQRILVPVGDPSAWRAEAEHWKDLGVTHLSSSFRHNGYQDIGAHLRAMERWRNAVATV